MAGRFNSPRKVDPMTLLPPHMREHIRPRHAGTKAWLFVSMLLVVIAVGRDMTSEPRLERGPDTKKASTAETTEQEIPWTAREALPVAPETEDAAGTIPAHESELVIKVKGDQEFKIKHKDKGVRFYWNGQTYKLELDGDKLELKLGGEGTQYHLKKKEEKWNLYHLGTRVYHVKSPDAGKSYAIYDNDGTKRFRVKIKRTSFNVYDGAGERLFKGKYKYGEHVVRDKRDDSKVLTLAGELTLEEAAMLSFPVEPPYRALLYLVLQ